MSQGVQPVASLNAPSKFMIRPSKLSAGQCSYSSLCKLVLRKRMMRLMLLSFLSTATLFAVSTSNLHDGLRVVFSPFSINRSVFAVVAFTLSVIPVIITRKLALITKAPPAPSSPSLRLKALLLNNKAYRLGGVYAASGVIYAVLFLTCISMHEEDAQFSPFTAHKRRGWQFNERFIFVIINAVVLGCTYAVHQLWNDRFVARFPSNISQSIPARVQAHLKRNIATAVKFAVIVVLTCLSSYFLLKKPIYRSIATVSLSTFRPHLFTLLRQNHLTFGLVLRTVVFAISLISIWETTNTLFDVYSVHPMLVSKISPSSNDCLLDGLASTDAYYRHLAYLEFVAVFSADQERRMEVYRDISRNPTTWDKFKRLAMQEMQDGRARVTNRGARKVKSASAATRAQASHTSQLGASSSSSKLRVLDDQKIYQRTSKSALESAIDDVQGQSTPGDLFKGVPAPQPIAQSSEEGIVGLDKLLPRDVLQTIKGIISGNEDSTVRAKVKVLAPEMKLVSLAALGLAYLGAASINEDQYGLIQHSIPQVITQLTETVMVYESLHAELVKADNKTNSAHLREYTMRLHEMNNALSVILVAFKDYIASFALDQKVLERVQAAIREL
ncbi:hypothetical protein E3P99_03885 [Wallemia hederae]|uniref:Nucleoporin protein Ndc1-Nup n=1 Tax=Wallemia hederae TaxID=1540922 RepID=A0A4T0FCX1_9BASI|nr:hypothetical protein E3P99_03885 [Wallemia hederae]